MSSRLPYLNHSDLSQGPDWFDLLCLVYDSVLASFCETVDCKVLVQSAKEVSITFSTLASSSSSVVRNRKGRSTEPCGTPLVTVDN